MKQKVWLITCLASYLFLVPFSNAKPSYGVSRLPGSFIANQANLNTIIGMICTLHSNNAQERDADSIRNGSNFFHYWNLTTSTSEFTVNGFCSLKLNPYTKEIEPGAPLTLKFETEALALKDPVIKGSLGGKTIVLNFLDQGYFSPNENRMVFFRSLKSVNLGKGLFDILLTQRSNQTLHNQSTEVWSASKYWSGYEPINLDYRTMGYTGKLRRLIISPAINPKTLLIKYGNYLHAEEDVIPFSPSEKSIANNIYLSFGPSSALGCTLMIYPGELDIPEMITEEQCRSMIQVFLKDDDLLQKINLPSLAELSPSLKDSSEQNERVSEAALKKRVEAQLVAFIKSNYPSYNFYCRTPNIFSQSCRAWSRNDKNRGFVNLNTSYTLNSEGTEAQLHILMLTLNGQSKTDEKRVIYQNSQWHDQP